MGEFITGALYLLMAIGVVVLIVMAVQAFIAILPLLLVVFAVVGEMSVFGKKVKGG